jgi:pantoate--beta-alanine ligase
MNSQHSNSSSVFTSCDQAYAAISEARRDGKRIGLVLTLGAIHEGHISLVKASRTSCDFTAATIFVNPAQFAPGEDFQKYPRTLDADLAAFAELGVDMVFAPSREEIFPTGFSTYVDPPQVATRFEGECRPQHFRGVTTIVLKLFNLLPADVTFFGQKDYQQCLVVQRMVRDLNLPIKIEMCPTVREADGLALSSRNRYLNSADRKRAVALSESLREAERKHLAGEKDATQLVTQMKSRLADAGIDRVDYAAIADAETLEPIISINRTAVALVAAYVGESRLIDNLLLRVA